MEKNIIVAISDNNAIGRNNELLWHISADLKFFRRKTLGWPVIMGRKTFESIGRALPGRVNVVVSRGFSTGEEVEVAGSLAEAFAIAESTNLEKCFVMGGGQIYAQALDEAETGDVVMLTADCDETGKTLILRPGDRKSVV